MKPESFDAWLATVPEAIKRDSLWKMEAYRLALYAVAIGWYDVTKLRRDRGTRDLATQLFEALGSVPANIAEGYSRGTGKDRARFYEYALGSARESRTWYYAGQHVLGEEITLHRIRLLTQIIRLMPTMVPQQRKSTIRESRSLYQVSHDTHQEATYDRLDSIPYPD